jgi:purine-binding chemotaxis protein CheW
LKFVVFYLGEETYALRVQVLREVILDKNQLTHVPNLPSFVSGILTLREEVIPVVHGAERLGYPPENRDRKSTRKILIVEYRNQTIGIRVEDVDSVSEFDDNEIKHSPQMIESMGARFVKGIIEPEENSDDEEKGLESAQWHFEDEETLLESTVEEDIQEKRTILLLDLDEVFDDSELQAIRQARDTGREQIGDEP